ncbi:hypothetical protein WA158_006131 [Blastocystis sp. Blastoise]
MSVYVPFLEEISSNYTEVKELFDEHSCTTVTAIDPGKYVSSFGAPTASDIFRNMAKNNKIATGRYSIYRPKSYGVCVKHLRKLARMGGSEYLGELAYNTMACEICKVANDDENMVLCDKCNGGFHIYCLKPILPSIPADDWYCDKCRAQIDKETKERIKKINKIKRNPKQYQSTIFEFFHAEPIDHHTCGKKRCIEDINEEESSDEDYSYKRKRTVRSCRKDSKSKKISKVKPTFHCFTPSSNNKNVNKQLLSLLSSMMEKNILFTNELVYPEHITKDMNSNKIDTSKVREMIPSELVEYNQYKSLWKQGQCTPVIVKKDKIQEADEDIEKDTIICEYCGVLEILENAEHCDNDSIMDLVCTDDTKTSLVIIPEKQGNLARYLSGINNHKKSSKKQQNVYSMRYAINGEIHLLLLAKRKITKGEVLYYDYNGYKYQYPTDHFV